MQSRSVTGVKVTAAEFRMLQRISEAGLTKNALRQGRGDTVALLRTLRVLILRDLVVETQNENGEVRFELTDAARRLTEPGAR